MKSAVLVFFALGISVACGQRVAPGVPPQHYQQPPQQYQQPPQHQQQYQQHPPQNLPSEVSPQQYHQQQINQQQQMQYQQVPVQQQAPIQQVPVQQAHQEHGGHHAPHGHHGQQQVLNAANIQHEREHIQEHMQLPIDTSKMSEAELQFHYFKMHDYDNNNKLDGCELIKSLIHWHVKDEGDKEKNADAKDGLTYSDEKLADTIDYVLSTMDFSKDGYVDYKEYRKGESDIINKP